MASKIIRYFKHWRLFGSKKRHVALGSYETLQDPKEIMLVVDAAHAPKPGDIVELDSEFARVANHSRYTRLLEANGAGRNEDFDPALNLKFSVVHLRFLDNLELIKHVSETRKKVRLLKSKKR